MQCCSYYVNTTIVQPENLAGNLIWRIGGFVNAPPNYTCKFCQNSMMPFGGWGLELLTTRVRDDYEAGFEDGVVQVLYQRAPNIPYESPLSFSQTSRINEHRSEACARRASTTNIRQKKEHRLESLPLNMDLQWQSDISQSFCPGKFSFLYTAQPPYLHSTPRSNVRTGRSVRVTCTSRDNYV